MIENYLTYLKFLDTKFEAFFEKQKPYVFCKKGCGLCCKNARFPYSQIEMIYLLSGLQKQDDATILKVMDNIKKVKAAKKEFEGERFLHDCPFLIDNICSVYAYRGIICRSFGLMMVGSDGKINVPFCCFDGYNYSNVMDDDGKNVSAEKFKSLQVKEEPIAFNISYNNLTDSDIETGFHFKFGEKKPLIDWFME